MPDNEVSYPLSPLQQGMLFHSLFASESGVDIEQVICTLREPLDLLVFQRAWATVVRRHTVLRSYFESAGGDAPIQISRDNAVIDWQLEDWRQLAPNERSERLEEFLEQDRRRDFTMDLAPLIRLALFNCGPDLHQFVWTFHHAILDGRSFPIVLSEVFECYRAHAADEEPNLEPPIPFGNFLKWLQERPRDGEERFWTKELSGFMAPTPIPSEKVLASSEGIGPQLSGEQRLTAEWTDQLRTAAESLSVTMNTFVQAAWALLLSRYSGQKDVVYGTTRACRHETVTGAESMIGLFINTVPLRVTWDAGTTTRVLLDQVRAKHLALRAVEHTALTDIKRWSEVESRTPVFESLVVFEKHSLNEQLRARGGDWRQRSFEYRGQTNFPLALIAYGGEELLLRIECDSNRFDQETISGMLDRLSQLLSRMVSNLDAPVDTLSDVAAEQQQLARWNQTRREYPTDVCLHELFEQQVAKTPDAVALIYDEQQLTYGQLNARANQLAHFLRDQGVQSDSRVGVFMHRGLDMVISLYAILKAGGAYVPLDPDYPPDRLSFMLEDSNCDLLLIQQDLDGALPPENRVQTIAVDDQWSMIAGSSVENPPRTAGPQNLAYVIYTSGSTGKPKGVMNEHAGICNRLFWMQDAFDLNEDDRVLQKTPFSFDVSVWEFFWPLLFGAKLIIARADGHKDPDYLVSLIEKHKVTTMHFVPSMLQAFLRAEDVETCSCLSRVICSGEALSYELQEMFFGRLDAELHNLYGPTEAAVDVTHWACRRSDERRIVPIGKPIANTQIHVLDAAMNPVPVGQSGELHIGGIQVARGYLNRAELTAEKFIPDPFIKTSSARLYKTGDLARFLPDGNVEYLGRIDHQVKIRGFRIELGEIESELCEHADVDEAIVLAREDNPGENRLVAYLVCDHTRPSIGQLRDHLQRKLPEYMVPALFVFLDALPLTHSGKVDRKKLPKPDVQRPELADRIVAPRTAVEEKIAAIWRSVLRIEQIGVHDNYFELGGDSIQSTLVVSAARKIGLKLTPKQLFESPTIAQLAVVADQGTHVIASEQGPIKGESPLTPIQHWFFEQSLADSHHFNQAFLFEVRQSLDENSLRCAMLAIEDHHDALRLRFRRESDLWHQEFSSTQTDDLPLEYSDLSTFSDAQIESEIAQTAAKVQSSLDIQNGPLWRVCVIRLADESLRLLIVVHHLVIDGVSWRILLEDLEQGYHQACEGNEITLAPKTTSFKAWAERLGQYAGTVRLANESSHWTRIAKLQRASLPLDVATANSTRSENTVSTACKVAVCLTEEESHDLLQRVPQAYNTMINDVLLTALASSIHSWTGNRQLLVNLEGHGREDLFDGVDLSRTLGWFTTIYPVHLELPDSSAPQDALKAIKEQLRAVPNRGIGYGLLRYLDTDVEQAAVTSGMSKPPTPGDPEIVFNYFGKFDDVLRDSQLFKFAKEETGPWYGQNQQRRHALEINCMILHGRLEIEWTYSSALHRHETIHAVAEAYIRSLRELIQHCVSEDAGGPTPSDYPLCGLDQPALDRLVAGSNDIEDIYPPSPIQSLFLAHAASQGGAILDHWQCTLTGDLEVEAFQQAWQEVFDCHSVLRASVRSEGLSEPLQIVHRQVKVPWTIDDWSGRPADQHEESWQQLQKKDRAIGMPLDQAPLSRFTLVRLDEGTHRFLWSVPSLLLDGWSWPLVFSDVCKAYQGRLKGKKVVLEKPRSYREYVQWLQEHGSNFDQEVVGSDGTRDASQREFWQSNLDGIREPTPLLSESPPTFESDATDGSDSFARVTCRPDTQTIEQLRKTVRARRTTIGALVQAAWSIVLSRLSGRRDVVFGAAFSGRPTDLAGAESMVGPFTNNLPVRVLVPGGESLGELLTATHDRLLRLNPYQFVPTAQVQAWSDVPWQHRLFDSLVVVQNYVVQESARRLGSGVSIENFNGPVHTNFPLLVLVEPDANWKISMVFDRRVIAQAAVERWKSDLIQVLRCIAEDLDANVEVVMARLSHPIAAENAHRKLFVQSQNYVPPRTPTQKAIAQVWSDTIQLDRISIEDNLFDLGVHSLLVVQLHKRLQDDFSKQIGLVTLFRYPTIFALAEHLDSGTQGSNRLQQSHDRGQRQRQMLASMKSARSRVKR